MYNGGKQLTTNFSYMGQNVQKCALLAIWGTPGKTGPILISNYPLTHMYVHVK